MASPSFGSYLQLLWTRFQGRGLLAALFTALAFALAVVWAWTGDGTYEPWANLMTLCAATAAVMATVWASMRTRVDTGDTRDEYSLSYALAYGYVQNFLVAAVQALQEQAAARGLRAGKVHVFRPVGLAQVEPAYHASFLKALEQRRYQCQPLALKSSNDRPRSVITVHLPDAPGQPLHFVDFPTTLLTLSSLLDYRAARAEQLGDEPWTHEFREALGHSYIEQFFKELGLQAERAHIREWIDFTDASHRNL
jgi:hypothetical protein